MSQNGKGSKPRPLSISQEEYDKRWDEIFKRHDKIKKEVEYYQDLLSTEDCVLEALDKIDKTRE